MGEDVIYAKQCPICNSTDIHQLFRSESATDSKFKRYIAQLNMNFSLKYGSIWTNCTNCDHLFLNPVLPDEIDQHLYEQESLYREFSFFEDIEKKVLERIDPTVYGKKKLHTRHYRELKNALAWVPRNQKISKIVDFGAGFGAATTAFEYLSVPYIGSEIDPWCLKLAENLERNVLDPEQIDDKFDLIYSCQVFEHIKDPYVIKQLFEKFSHRNTFLYIDVPSHTASISSLTTKGLDTLNWTHFHAYTPKSIMKMVSNLGFRPLRVSLKNGDIKILAINEASDIKGEFSQSHLNSKLSIKMQSILGPIFDVYHSRKSDFLNIMPEEIKQYLRK